MQYTLERLKYFISKCQTFEKSRHLLHAGKFMTPLFGGHMSNIIINQIYFKYQLNRSMMEHMLSFSINYDP